MPKEEDAPVYLGDGVYASHDGYQVWLSVDNPYSPHRIALEDGVFQSFLRYVEKKCNVTITVTPNPIVTEG